MQVLNEHLLSTSDMLRPSYVVCRDEVLTDFHEVSFVGSAVQLDILSDCRSPLYRLFRIETSFFRVSVVFLSVSQRS